eukprot:6486274-Amphidinium_carterae.2
MKLAILVWKSDSGLLDISISDLVPKELVKNGAKMPLPDKLAKLKIMKDQGVVFGKCFKTCLIKWAAQSETDPHLIVGILSPCGGGSFDVLSPKLAAAQLHDVDAAAVLLKNFVHDKLLDLISKGEECVEQVFALCAAMKAAHPIEESLAELEPVVGATLEEILEICAYFEAIQTR